MQKLIVDGRLGQDAQLKTSMNGTQFINFRFATNWKYKGENETTWYDVYINDLNRFGNMLQYLKKGNYFIITGELQFKTRLDDNGVPRFDLKLQCVDINFGGGGNGESNKQENGQQTVAQNTVQGNTSIPVQQPIPTPQPIPMPTPQPIPVQQPIPSPQVSTNTPMTTMPNMQAQPQQEIHMGNNVSGNANYHMPNPSVPDYSNGELPF